MGSTEINLLGRLSLRADGRCVQFPTRKAEVLFSYLALNHDREISRIRLAGILWPDSDDDRARRNLSTTLWRVRKAVRSVQGIELQADPRFVTLQCNENLVDAWRFEALSKSDARGLGDPNYEALLHAEKLYGGDLLEDYQDEWCEEQRRYLRMLHVRLLKRLVVLNKEAGNFESGIGFGRKAAVIDPLDEEIHRELMLLYHLRGDRSLALAQYDTLRRALHEELGIRPSQESTQLWVYIRANADPTPSQLRPPAGESESSLLDESNQIPCVGRRSQLASLIGGLERASLGQGGAAVIVGEAGIGKTKLVETLILEAEMRGFEVLQGRCPDMQNAPPYHVFVQALWPRISAAEGFADATPSPLVALVRALAPDTLPRSKRRREKLPFSSAIVIETLLDLLAARHSPRPTLLVLEGLHRIDRASETALISLLGRLNRLQVFAVVTLRTQEGSGDEVLANLVANGAEELRLGGLSPAETTTLIQVILRSKHVSNKLVDYIWERTGGTPLFVLEFLKFMREQGSLTKDIIDYWSINEHLQQQSASVPSRVTEVVRKRIDLIDIRSRLVLGAASVLGREVNFEHLRVMTELSEDELVEVTDRIVGLQLLAETESGFRFPHESIRSVALAALSTARRKRLHLKTGRLLERLSPGRTEEIAWHFEEAGNLEGALTYAEISGDRARAVHANEDATGWYARALRILQGLEAVMPDHAHRRAALLLKRQDALDILGDREGQSVDIEATIQIARRLGDRSLLARALDRRAQLLTRINASEDALHSVRSAIRMFRAMGDLAGEARAHETAGLVHFNVRKHRSSRSEFLQALTLFRRVRDRDGEARILANLGSVAAALGENLAAVKYLDLADELLLESDDQRSRAFVSLQRGILMRFLGNLKRSEELLLAGLQMMGQIGDRVGEARALIQLAATHAWLGRLREALHEARRALRIARETKDIRAQILVLNNLAYIIHRCLGDFGRAERYLAEAMRLVSSAGGIENPSIYHDTMAAILLDKGKIDAALNWARQGEQLYKALGLKSFLGLELQLRLGNAYLDSGQEMRALAYLRRVLVTLKRTSEPPLKIHTLATLARLHLGRGDTARALRYARRSAELLRKVDGLDQIQRIYWIQFQVFSSCGLKAVAQRALRKAHGTVMQQASTMRGRMRSRFLLEVTVNREIIDEVVSSRGRTLHQGSVVGIVDPAASGSSPITNDDRRGQPVIVAAADSMNDREERRRAVLELLRAHRMTQAALAASLGVSVRTIRNDLAKLKELGLLVATQSVEN